MRIFAVNFLTIFVKNCQAYNRITIRAIIVAFLIIFFSRTNRAIIVDFLTIFFKDFHAYHRSAIRAVIVKFLIIISWRTNRTIIVDFLKIFVKDFQAYYRGIFERTIRAIRAEYLIVFFSRTKDCKAYNFNTIRTIIVEFLIIILWKSNRTNIVDFFNNICQRLPGLLSGYFLQEQSEL